MRSIVITTMKGGSGKTTITVHLAVEAMLAGEKVAIVDTDEQASALAWYRTRKAKPPLVIAIDPGRLPAALAEALNDGYTTVFVDTAPRAEPVTAATLRACDYCVVPVRPSAFDLATLPRTIAMVKAAQKPGNVLLNACPARAPEIAEARAICAKSGLPLASIELGERRAYGRAVQTGLAVTEFDPAGAAADEIRALWRFVDERTSLDALSRI